MRRTTLLANDRGDIEVSLTPKAEIVYVVDDDSRVREALSDLLTSFEIEVISFASARDYLEHARSEAIACLILDLELPDINGLDLQSQLARERGPPIIFISGHGSIPSTVRAMKAGAIEFLTKPVDNEALLAAIRTGFAQDRIMHAKVAEIATLQGQLAQLTPREREVLPLVISGMRNKQAAAILGITEVTVQVHRGQIMRKMGAKSFADLVRMGGVLGIGLSTKAASDRPR